MIDREHDLPITKAGGGSAHQPWQRLLPAAAGVGDRPGSDAAALTGCTWSSPSPAMDITYIRMARGFVYLAAVLDWFSRRVLSWRVSITMEAAFCVETLEEALANHGKPEIFNTDQGSQFTGSAFTGVLANSGIAISMDGKGAWRDNVFVERLWRSVKYCTIFSVSAFVATPIPTLTICTILFPKRASKHRSVLPSYVRA